MVVLISFFQSLGWWLGALVFSVFLVWLVVGVAFVGFSFPVVLVIGIVLVWFGGWLVGMCAHRWIRGFGRFDVCIYMYLYIGLLVGWCVCVI